MKLVESEEMELKDNEHHAKTVLLFFHLFNGV